MSGLHGTVVDTDVFGLLYVLPPSDDRRIGQWRQTLAARRIVIAFQTRAEILAGALRANWGATRMRKVVEVLERTPTIHTDDEVVDAYVALTTECRRAGHALHDRTHTGDRWIAACAIAKRFDLLSGDSIYEGAPNLTLRNEDDG